MQVSSLNAQAAFTMFDAWMQAVENRIHSQRGGVESPLIDAAFKAFDAYATTVEAGNAAMIAGVGAQLGYQMNAGGNSASPVSTQTIAPFLALNVMA